MGKVFPAEDALLHIQDIFGDYGPLWSKTTLISILCLQVRAGQIEAGKNTLEFLLSRAVNMPAPPPSGSIKEFKLRQSRIGYNDILGISSRALNGLPSNDGEKLISMSNRLFPSPTNRKGQEWLQHAQTALNVWIREGTVEAGETLRLMSLMAWRFHQAGDRERVKTIMATISRHLQNIQFKQKEPIDLDIISFMVVVGRETGERLDLKVMWGNGVNCENKPQNLAKHTPFRDKEWTCLSKAANAPNFQVVYREILQSSGLYVRLERPHHTQSFGYKYISGL